jgi:hypothetical protein|tara:strand:- start:940 stop:1491 length:552 start_codon:yes stop_codon:yes gene_type:complete
MHQTALEGFQKQREASQRAALAGTGAGGSQAGGASGKYPTSGYSAGGGGGRTSKIGPYGYEPFKGRYGLTVPASDSFTKLESAYRNTFGENFSVGTAWRSMDEEAYYWNRYLSGQGPMASKPGTGVHGYGTAVDINGSINNVGSKQHAWLRQNAAQFGWHWVGQRWNEPWHWEYFPDKDQSRR